MGKRGKSQRFSLAKTGMIMKIISDIGLLIGFAICFERKSY